MKIYEFIANELTTKEQKTIFLQQIQEIMENLYSTQTDLQKSVAKDMVSPWGELLVEGMVKDGVDIKSKSAVKEYLQGLVEYLEKVPVITLSLAQDPNAKMMQTVLNWLKRNKKKPLFMEIKVDPSIIAGIILQYQGVYKNYSLKQLTAK